MTPRQPRSALAVAALLAAASAAAADTYVVDFFPEEPSPSNTIQLRFMGPTEGTVTGARLVIGFTTFGSFDAADLSILLVAPITPSEPGGGFWFLTGEDLGWSGQGTFTRDLTTTAMNGTLNPGLWGFDVGSLLDPPAYGGSFSADTRFEVTIVPAPAAAAIGVVSLPVLASRRRRPAV